MNALPRPALLLAASIGFATLLARPAAGEVVLAEFPLVLRAGLAAEAAAGEAAPSAGGPGGRPGRVLADLPFDPERGYGYVGGVPQRLAAGRVLGGAADWIPAWREGVEKYLFRLPRGEYLVEMTFLETDAASPGARVFDVLAEDQPLFPAVDVAARAGDFAWLTLSGVASVYDGWLDLRFVPSAGGKPARVSRLRLLERRAPDAASRALEPLAPRASGGPRQVALDWDPPPWPGVAGYRVLRSEAAAGPFAPVSAEPVQVPFFLDRTAPPGRELFYQVAAFGAPGEQTPLSPPVAARAIEPAALGLKVYDLHLAPDALRALHERGSSAEVAADLHYLGSVFGVKVRTDGEPFRWQRKKSYHLTADRERNRTFLSRSALFLSAEAGDATVLREKLAAEAAAALGLASPQVTPVALLLNGEFTGLYFDIEALDARFRVRTRLDRAGLLARVTRGDLLHGDWRPYGEQVGEEGNVAALTELVHELNRLNQGETASFFVERFYLDRFIDRTALAIIRGEADRTAALRHFLKDSRNGKWERLQDLHRSGDWGSEDWKADLRVPDAEEARRILFGRSLEAADLFRGEPSVLETRFFLDPALRARLFARVLELLDGDLSPARVGALAEGCLAAIREAGAHDVDRARGDGERAAFLSAPERLRAAHEARAAAIRAAIAREKDRKPPPIILNEVLLRPAAGEPWIEIRNTANEAVSLRGYRLVKAFGRPRDVLRDPAVAAPLDRFGELAPGELRVLKLAAGEVFPAPAGGGFIALYRVEAAAGQGAASPELADALFHGHQTAGVAYGRRGGGPAGAAGEEPWAFLARPTPGAANDADALALPAHDFRQEVARDDAGAVTIALQPRSATAEAPARPEKVVLRHREDGAGEFAETMLSWDDKRFRFSVQLPASPERPRTAYYFLVTQPGGVERTYPLAAPEVTFFIPVHPRVRINEVLPRPGQEEGVPGQDGGIPGQDGGIPGQDGGIPGQKPSPLGEFIEIHNAEETPVDLEGYFLTDSNRNPAKWRLPAGSIVGPKGFIVFYADGLAGGNHTNFKLSNSGEYLGLFGRMEEGNLPVDTLAFRGMRTGESWGASPDGSKNFRAWKDPTPGKRNLPKIPAEFLKKKREEGEAGAAGAEPGGEVPVPVPEEVPKDREGNTKERGGA